MSSTPQGGSTGAADPEALRIAEAHLWNWFALHAGQRMQLVNFFLIAVSFFSAAYVAAIAKEKDGLAAVIGLVGFIFSVAFWRLEERTAELVHAAEAPMAEIERLLASSTSITSIEIVKAVEKPTHKLSSYATIVRSLVAVSAMAFLSGAFYALA